MIGKMHVLTARNIAIAAGLSLSALFGATPASADVLLNNFTSPCNADGSCTFNGYNNSTTEINTQQGSFIQNTGSSFQAIGVSFNSGSDVTLTDFVAYMYNSGNLANIVDFELMASVSGVPSNVALDTLAATTVGRPANDNTIDSNAYTVNWSLTPNTQYWLVAVAQTVATSHFVWNGSPYTAGYAYESGSSSNAWNLVAGGTAPAAQINGSQTPVSSPVPEPASLAIFGSGLAGLCWLRRRKARRG